MPMTISDMVRNQAFRLDPEEQLALIEDLTRHFRANFAPPSRKPVHSLQGILKDFGPAPSSEEIDDLRREVRANFPSEDIA